MKISICIPAFGREKMLNQAIFSILAQEHEDWEVIIRHDGPSDYAPIVDSRIRFSVGEHFGTYSKVANAVISKASGDILYLMGSDDLLAPSALYAVNKVFEEERFGGAFWLYGKTISTDSHLRFQGVDGGPASYKTLLQANCIGCPSVFWNRQMQNIVGTFDTRFKWAADYDRWLTFWEIREPLFLDQELGIFRHHDHQMSTEQRAEIEQEAKWVSLRHQTMGPMLQTARSRWVTRQAYEGDDSPLSHDDIGN